MSRGRDSGGQFPSGNKKRKKTGHVQPSGQVRPQHPTPPAAVPRGLALWDLYNLLSAPCFIKSSSCGPDTINEFYLEARL